MAPSIPIPTQGGMFHTFQGVTPRKASTDSQDSVKSSGTPTAKRITTPHACAECKRRKIRCDGQQPCGQCRSSRPPKRCFYDKHRQRVIPSRKTLEALSQSLDECRSILKRLYPNQEVQALLPLSRHDLLSLLDRPMLDTSVGGLPSPPLNTSPISELESENLLEQMPARDIEWDDERRGRDPIHAEADDINTVSLSVIKAALMVMLKVQSGLRNSLATPLNSVEMSHNTILDLLEAMEEWSLAARHSRDVVWRMYEASRAIQAQQAAHRSQSPSMHITGEGMLMTSGLSGPGSEGSGMMGMLDQGGLPWELDVMYWGAQGGGGDDAAAVAAAHGLQAHAAVGMDQFLFFH